MRLCSWTVFIERNRLHLIHLIMLILHFHIRGEDSHSDLCGIWSHRIDRNILFDILLIGRHVSKQSSLPYLQLLILTFCLTQLKLFKAILYTLYILFFRRSVPGLLAHWARSLSLRGIRDYFTLLLTHLILLYSVIYLQAPFYYCVTHLLFKSKYLIRIL